LFGAAKEFGRTYANASGIDATGDDIRVGVETDRSAKLSATASIGGASIVASGANGAGGGGVVADASATWLPSALTTVTLAASSNLDVTNSAGAAALRTSQASLDVKHQLRRWLALMAGIADISHAYSGIGLSDVQLTGHIGVEYDFNREWALFGDVQRTEFASSDSARSYTENQLRFGVRLER
jgi:hypothetical protein